MQSNSNENRVPAESGKPVPREIRCKKALCLVEREAVARRADAETVAIVISLLTDFCRLNGYQPDSRLEPDFVRHLNQAVIRGDFRSNDEISFPPIAKDNPKFLNFFGSFDRGARALLEADFSSVVRRWSDVNRHLTYKEISLKSGLRPNSIKSFMTDARRFVTELTPQEAFNLDATLSANGEIFMSYLATSQQTAYAHFPTIKNELLGLESFGQKLRHFRKATKLTRGKLLKEVHRRTKIKIAKSQLSGWESEICLPCRGMECVVQALDEICSANGELLKQWWDQNPRELYLKYALPAESWTTTARKLIARIIDYKTTNTENLPRSEEHPDRWSD